MEQLLLSRALEYLAQGLAPIPINPHTGGKSPYIKWADYQNRLPTKEEVLSWWKEYPDAQVGIITGRVSGIIVVDVDPRNGGEESLKGLNFPPTYIVRTGGGGWHYYYLLPKGKVIGKKTGWRNGIDIQAEKALVVAPPSLHKSGNLYEERTDFDQITEAPEWLLSDLNSGRDFLFEQASYKGVAMGGRNNAAAKVIGSILVKLPLEKWETEGWRLTIEWNQKNAPPLEDKELMNVFKSIAAKEMEQRDKHQDKENRLIAFIQPIADHSECFVDELGNPCLKISVNGHKEILKCAESRLSALLMREFSSAFGRIPSTEEQKKMRDFLKSVALMNETRRILKSRLAMVDGVLFYDLCTPDWKVLKIGREGCHILQDHPVYFRRNGYQLAQVNPDFKYGNAEILFKYFNLNTEEEKRLLLVALITAFIPDIARPIFVFHGEQGTAKTTLSRVCKRVIDPSTLEVTSLPNKEDDLIVGLSNNYSMFFDNVSGMSWQISDTLCRAVTGGGVAKRKLFTDGDDAVFNFKRVIGINGINQIIERPDLLERSLIFELKIISPEERLDEEEYWERFNNDLPIIVGGIFNILSLALGKKTATKAIKGLPRMADFGKWATIIASCLGYGDDFFKQAYEHNALQQENAILDQPVVAALLKFMEMRETWQGNMSDLLYALTSLPQDMWHRLGGIKLDLKANTLSRAIKRFQPPLRKIGIHIREIGQRQYLIERKISSVEVMNMLKNDSSDITSVFDG